MKNKIDCFVLRISLFTGDSDSRQHREEKKEVQRGKKRGNLPHLVVFLALPAVTCGTTYHFQKPPFYWRSGPITSLN
jgi:hypothetical protein